MLLCNSRFYICLFSSCTKMFSYEATFVPVGKPRRLLSTFEDGPSYFNLFSSSSPFLLIVTTAIYHFCSLRRQARKDGSHFAIGKVRSGVQLTSIYQHRRSMAERRIVTRRGASSGLSPLESPCLFFLFFFFFLFFLFLLCLQFVLMKRNRLV